MTAPEAGRSKATRTKVPVRGSLEQQLLASAAAAGASLIAAQPATAKVIYTPMNLTIETGIVPLDLNQDGVVDFNLVERANTGSVSISRGLNINGAANPGAAVAVTSFGGASALALGAMIGYGGRFGKVQNVARSMAHLASIHLFGTTAFCTGAFALTPSLNCTGVIDRFLGLRFVVSGKSYYGWAGFSAVNVGWVNAKPYIHARLVGFAYEDVPGQSIRAGQLQDSAADVGAPPNPRPATLGLLALGAPGLDIWRRRSHVSS